jgi:glycosyltransferase involved in cell wall biosynthesis
MRETSVSYQQGKVSIIIPMYNRVSLLPETLDSILAQTYINWECILVDDGSTDETLSVANEYARKDSRFREFSRPSHIRKGANGCRNYGYNLSDGEFIQWFDSDDLMENQLLDFRVKQMMNSSIDLLVSPAKFFSITSGIKIDNDFRKIKFDEAAKAFQFLAQDSWFQTSQCLIRRSFIGDEILPFKAMLPRNQETELFVRWLLKNPSIEVNNDGPFVLIRHHQDSISGQYNLIVDDEKIHMDIHAYKLMYESFKNANQLTKEVNNFFSIFFYKAIRQLRPLSLDYIKVFYFSLVNGLLPPDKKVISLFIYRILGLC